MSKYAKKATFTQKNLPTLSPATDKLAPKICFWIIAEGPNLTSLAFFVSVLKFKGGNRGAKNYFYQKSETRNINTNKSKTVFQTVRHDDFL